MANINIGGQPTPSPTPTPTPVPNNNNNNVVANQPVSGGTGQPAQTYNDPTKITVSIADQNTPIVVLFGPPACGKAMTLVRLCRFLKKYGYQIKPETTFRPSDDTEYRQMCKDFNTLIGSQLAASSTTSISFMLVNVYDNRGTKICQILESPGEHHFLLGQPANNEFMPYLHTIFSSNNRKIWSVFVEPNNTSSMNTSDYTEYVQRIRNLKNNVKPKDDFIIVYNKIDETPFTTGQAIVNEKSAIDSIKDNYKGLLDLFKNNNIITSIFRTYNCRVNMFQSGAYNQANDGSTVFTESNDSYPKRLWESVMSFIRG